MELKEVAKGELCSLKEALDCEYEALILDGFMHRYQVDEDEARAIFQETKKWLWLAAKASEEESMSLFIDKPLLVIDEMWHNFILYTRQYQRYCMEKFKKFIHHAPTPKSKELQAQYAVQVDLSNSASQLKQKYEQQLSYIYDHLGAETVLKWYEELPAKYTPEYLQQIKQD
jgi:hypothetical protein